MRGRAHTRKYKYDPLAHAVRVPGELQLSILELALHTYDMGKSLKETTWRARRLSWQRPLWLQIAL